MDRHLRAMLLGCTTLLRVGVNQTHTAARQLKEH